jgi:hypothetical protein
MTLTRDEISERVSDLAGYDFEPPCDGRPTVKFCGAPAKWAGLFSCMDDRLWCDEHRAEAEAGAQHRKGIWCLTCWAQGVHIIHVEPIGGGR